MGYCDICGRVASHKGRYVHVFGGRILVCESCGNAIAKAFEKKKAVAA